MTEDDWLRIIMFIKRYISENWREKEADEIIAIIKKVENAYLK